MALKPLPYLKHFTNDHAHVNIRSLSLAGRGLYIDLRDYQWVEGSVPEDPKGLALALGVMPKDFAKAWAEIAHLFPLCEDGRRRNQPLESQRDTTDAKRQKLSENGEQGGRGNTKEEPNGKQKLSGDKAKALGEETNPKAKSESESESESETSPSVPQGSGPTVEAVAGAIVGMGWEPDEAHDLALRFIALHEPTGWRLNGKPIENWPYLLQKVLPGLVSARRNDRLAREQGNVPIRSGPRVVTAEQLEAFR